MSDFFSTLYPGIEIGNSLRSGYSSVPDLIEQTKTQQPTSQTPEELYIKNGGVNYDLYLSGGLLSNTVKPHEILMKWNDYINQIMLQAGKGNVRINYEHKF